MSGENFYKESYLVENEFWCVIVENCATLFWFFRWKTLEWQVWNFYPDILSEFCFFAIQFLNSSNLQDIFNILLIFLFNNNNEIYPWLCAWYILFRSLLLWTCSIILWYLSLCLLVEYGVFCCWLNYLHVEF